MRPFLPARLIILLLGAWCLAAALEPPTGIAAILPGDDEQLPCGGSAVVVARRDGALIAITLEEALPAGDRPLRLLFPGGVPRTATVERRGVRTTALALRIPDVPGAAPLACADSDRAAVGLTVWTAGNASASLEHDGQVAISRGLVSGRYGIPADAPPVRGRAGRELSRYRGPVLELDAAVNDGNQGGAVLDDAGRLLGLVSLGCTRERRLGTAVPLRAVLADLGLDLPLAVPAPPIAAHAALAQAAQAVAPSVALVYLQRPGGLGNPEAVPRPPTAVDQAPLADREGLQRWWNMHYHQQQMFWTDQPVSAVCVDAERGLLITAASNLHGGATQGLVLAPDGGSVPCTVVATHAPLDLALLRAERPLPLTTARLSAARALRLGEAVGIVGRHQVGAEPTLTAGVVSATTRRRLRSDHAFRQTDAEGNYGSLGGPVVSADGALIGLVVMLGPEDDERPWLINSGVTLFVDAAAVAAALPALTAGTSTARGTFVGLGVTMDYSGKRPVVKAVGKDSGAERAGLKPGDLLESVAGVRIHDHMTIVRTLMRRTAGERVEVVVRRGGVPVTLLAELREIQE